MENWSVQDSNMSTYIVGWMNWMALVALSFALKKHIFAFGWNLMVNGQVQV